jgi:hypothetical protein
MNMSSLAISQHIRDVGKIYMLSIGIFNLVTGITGNILIILVFTTVKVFKGNQCAFYLIVESISNIGLLLAVYVSTILTHILGYDPYLTSLNWCKIRTMISQAFALCSLYTVCFLAFDQYLSTNHRYSWRQLSTLKLAHCFVFVNVCFVVIHSTSFLFVTEIHQSMGCAVYNPIIKRYYAFFYYPILSSILPLIITTSFSLLAYRNVRRIIRRQVPVIRRRLDRQFTAITLARVVCIVSCGMPFIFVSLYELNMNNNEDNYVELAIVNLISTILNSLLYTNFSVN